MRIVVVGARGQLGTDLCQRLAGEVVGLDLPELDVGELESVESALRRAEPEVVVNCAAMTNVDLCEDEVGAAFAVNAQGAYHVALASERVGAALMYISTDYVFGAQTDRQAAYTEDDLPGPVNIYGASKLAGECVTRGYCRRHWIVRTSGLYGLAGARGKGGNFVETMLRLAGERRPLRVVSDQRLSPTSTWELAGKIGELIGTKAYGLYHLAARDSCTWHEFAEAILEHEAVPVTVEAIRSEEYAARARRPGMSALRSARLAGIGLEPCPPWRPMLHQYLSSRRQDRGEGASQASGDLRGSGELLSEGRQRPASASGASRD